MARPAETAPMAPTASGGAGLTPDEADRLASTIRPSWELDDAPFTGPGTLSADDLQALQGGGIHPAVRAVAHDGSSRSHATNGSHPPAPATPSREPESSVILDPALAAELLSPDPRPAPSGRPATTVMGLAAVLPSVAPGEAAPATTSPLQRPPTPRRPVAPPFHILPPGPVRARAATLSPEEAHPRKPKTAFWVALGLAGLAMIGLVAWIAASSGRPDSAPAPSSATTASGDKAAALLPATPPAETPAPAAEPAPTATAPAPIAPVPARDLPQAAPIPAHAAPAAPPRLNYAVPRPAGKPKGAQTIVRDVPF
jgi:hypothetical protein